MSIFARPHYTSDTTQFIDQLKKQRPELDAQLQAGRALLWDKQVDRGLWQQFKAAQVPQSYAYRRTRTIINTEIGLQRLFIKR